MVALDASGRVGALVVGGRFADRVPAWEEAPVIHPVARGGPECRAVLGGSIKRAAVLLEWEEEATRAAEKNALRQRVYPDAWTGRRLRRWRDGNCD